MNSFEEHARTAAADAHESVTRLPVPELGEFHRTVRSRVAIAAVAVLALAVVGTLALGDRGGTDLDAVADSEQPVLDPDETAIDATTGYYAFPIDADWTVFATDEGTRPELSMRFSLFGAGPDDDAIADGFLLIGAIDAADSDERLDDGEPVTVRRMDGVAIDGFIPGSLGLEWFEPDGTNLQLVSDVLTYEQMLALAEQFVIDGNSVEAPTPTGMRLLIDDASETEVTLPGFGWTLFARSGDDAQLRSLLGTPGDSGASLLLARVLFDAHEPVSVRGTTGWLTSDGWLVVWHEGDTILALTSDSMIDPVELAEQIVPLTAEQWQALLDQSVDPRTVFGDDGDDEIDDGSPSPATIQDAEPATPDELPSELIEWDDVVAQGSGTLDGSQIDWILYTSPDRALCMVATGATADLRACAAPYEGQILEFGSVVGDEFGVLLGWVSDSVDELVLTTTDGDDTFELHPAAEGTKAFLAVIPASNTPISFQLYDESGALVHDHFIQWNGALPPGYPLAGQPGRSLLGEWGDEGMFWRLDRLDDGTYCAEASIDDGRLEVSCGARPVMSFPIGGGTWAVVGLLPECTDSLSFRTETVDHIDVPDFGRNGSDEVTFGLFYTDLNNPPGQPLAITIGPSDVEFDLKTGADIDWPADVCE